MFKVDNILSGILNCYVEKKSISKMECMRQLNKLTEDCVDENIKLKCSDLLEDSNTLSLLEHLHPHLLHQICILFAVVCPVVDCRLEELYRSSVGDPCLLFGIICRKISILHRSSALNVHFRVERHPGTVVLAHLRRSMFAMTGMLVDNAEGNTFDHNRNSDAQIRCLQTLAVLFEMENDFNVVPLDEWSRFGCSNLVYFFKQNDDLIVNLALENLFAILSKILVDWCSTKRSNVTVDFDHELLLNELRTAAVGRLQSTGTCGRGRWFGGIVAENYFDTDTTTMRLFILCSMMTTTIVGKSKPSDHCCSLDWIGDLVVEISKNRSIVGMFAENDDQLALLLLCCCLLFSLNCTIECLFPCSLWFEFFQSMNWNASAILSLILETNVSFLVSFVTFLKLFNHQWNKLNSVCFSFIRIERSDIDDKRNSTTSFVEDSSIAVTIEEMKQGRCHQSRQYKIQPLPCTTVAQAARTSSTVVRGTCSTFYSKFVPMLQAMKQQLATGQYWTSYKSCTLLIDQILAKLSSHS
ncbi:hypothetical protein T01_15522 [Trichinella spiralis]|uniref:Uncharacterized protein n=1 Tax=Trichinella spiralis TaxID=6334 RepID=A0A0V1BBG2_TRISP|nr:hypothetical protein T01_15522 [Trichinella spiralis]